MTHEHPHPQPGAGHLTFATGAVVSGDPRTVEERILAGEHVPLEEINALPGTRVEIVHGTMESEAVAYNATHGRPDQPPEGARVMPSGHWVTVRDPRTLTRGDKRDLIRQGSRTEGQTQAEQMIFVQDLVHKLMITGWSYPFPLPSVDLDSLNKVPVEDDDALEDLIGETHKLLFPPAPSPDQHADPTSPTAPSGE